MQNRKDQLNNINYNHNLNHKNSSIQQNFATTSNIPPQLGTLSSSAIPVTVTAVLLGVEGPKCICTTSGFETVLHIFQLADESLPNGIELRIWGPRGARVAGTVRAFDIVTVSKIRVRKEQRSPYQLFLQWNEGSDVQNAKEDRYKSLIKKWRDDTFGNVIRMANRGKVRLRDWQLDEGDHKKKKACETKQTQQLQVFINGVYVRLRRDVKSMKGLCKRICERCNITIKEELKGCLKCGVGAGYRWEYGQIVLELKQKDNDKQFIARAKGDVVRKLLMGIEAQSVIEDNSCDGKVKEILDALANDQGVFIAVIQGEIDSENVVLVDLFVG